MNAVIMFIRKKRKKKNLKIVIKISNNEFKEKLLLKKKGKRK